MKYFCKNLNFWEEGFTLFGERGNNHFGGGGVVDKVAHGSTPLSTFGHMEGKSENITISSYYVRGL